MAPDDDDEDAFKIDIIEWFLQRYEDPVECLSWVGEEGGYQWIAGPHDAYEVLEENFGHLVPDELLKQAAEKIEEDGSTQWVCKAEYDRITQAP